MLRWTKRAVACLLLTCTVLVLLEGGLRFARWVARPEPEVTGTVDAEHPREVLCIGDSITHGMTVEQNEAYPSLLPLIWRSKKNAQVRTTNLALPGANTSEQLLRLKKHLEENPQYRPDAALVLVGFNNRWNLHDASFWENEKVKQDNYTTYLRSKLQLDKILRVQNLSAKEAAKTAQKTPGEEYNKFLSKRGWNLFFRTFEDPFLRWWIRRDLKEITRVVRSRDAKTVFLTYHYERFGHLNQLIRDTARNLGVDTIDLEQPQDYYEKRNLLTDDHMHLNAEGHKDLSRRVGTNLLELDALNSPE